MQTLHATIRQQMTTLWSNGLQQVAPKVTCHSLPRISADLYIIMWCIVKYGDPSAFNPSKCTHTAVSSEHTHCEHTPGAVGSHCSSAQGAVGGSVPCSREPQSWYWRRRECCSFTIPTFNPCRTWDSNLQPLDYKSDSLTTRPRLPLHISGQESHLRWHADLQNIPESPSRRSPATPSASSASRQTERLETNPDTNTHIIRSLLIQLYGFILGVARLAEKNWTIQFFTHGSGHARTTVQFKSDNASVIWFVINNTEKKTGFG